MDGPAYFGGTVMLLLVDCDSLLTYLTFKLCLFRSHCMLRKITLTFIYDLFIFKHSVM